jgi:hypothetical protein
VNRAPTEETRDEVLAGNVYHKDSSEETDDTAPDGGKNRSPKTSTVAPSRHDLLR